MPDSINYGWMRVRTSAPSFVPHKDGAWLQLDPQIEIDLCAQVIDTSPFGTLPDVVRLLAKVVDQNGDEHMCTSHISTRTLFRKFFLDSVGPESDNGTRPGIGRVPLFEGAVFRCDTRALSYLRVSGSQALVFPIHEKYLSWSMAIYRVEQQLPKSTSTRWELMVLDPQPDADSIEMTARGKVVCAGGVRLSSLGRLSTHVTIGTLLWRNECKEWEVEGRSCWGESSNEPCLFARTGGRGEPTTGVHFTGSPDWTILERPQPIA